jgi:hypothetical protein
MQHVLGPSQTSVAASFPACTTRILDRTRIHSFTRIELNPKTTRGHSNAVANTRRTANSCHQSIVHHVHTSCALCQPTLIFMQMGNSCAGHGVHVSYLRVPCLLRMCFSKYIFSGPFPTHLAKQQFLACATDITEMRTLLWLSNRVKISCCSCQIGPNVPLAPWLHKGIHGLGTLHPQTSPPRGKQLPLLGSAHDDRFRMLVRCRRQHPGPESLARLSWPPQARCAVPCCADPHWSAGQPQAPCHPDSKRALRL